MAAPVQLYQCVRGSQCHGLSNDDSDLDTFSVFCSDIESLLGTGIDYLDEVSYEKHDDMCWDLRKFGNLLVKSNPSALEGLFVDPEFRIVVHPAFQPFIDNREKFLSKACFDSFANYARNQIQRARGLNKMINKPILERKTPVDFCYVVYGNDTVPFTEWLSLNGLQEVDVSLAKLNHFRDAYAIFKHPGGICRDNANDVHCCNIPKGLDAIGTLYFNKDHYTTHCKDYKSQEEWKVKRNPKRYESNLGKSYDGKNMRACIRLITNAVEIAKGQGYIVNRSGIDKDLLLAIGNHELEYEEIMDIANAKVDEMNEAVKTCNLPDAVNPILVNDLVVEARKQIYFGK